MSEKEQKMGGASEEKRCTKRVIEVPIAVTAFELRRLAGILQALADASEVGSPFKRHRIDPIPQRRVVQFNVCDLRIVDTFSDVPVAGSETQEKVLSGCEITPNVLTRGESYCLCNDTEDKMRVEFLGGAISPDKFSLVPHHSIPITVSDTGNLYGYKIWRDDGAGGETLCSDTGGPNMGIQDPPGGG